MFRILRPYTGTTTWDLPITVEDLWRKSVLISEIFTRRVATRLFFFRKFRLCFAFRKNFRCSRRSRFSALVNRLREILSRLIRKEKTSHIPKNCGKGRPGPPATSPKAVVEPQSLCSGSLSNSRRARTEQPIQGRTPSSALPFPGLKSPSSAAHLLHRAISNQSLRFITKDLVHTRTGNSPQIPIATISPIHEWA